MTRRLFHTLEQRIALELLLALLVSGEIYVNRLHGPSLSDSPRLLLASIGVGALVGVCAVFFRLSSALTTQIEALVFACVALVVVLLSPSSLPDTVWIVLVSATWANIVTKVSCIRRGVEKSAQLYPGYGQNSTRE